MHIVQNILYSQKMFHGEYICFTFSIKKKDFKSTLFCVKQKVRSKVQLSNIRSLEEITTWADILFQGVKFLVSFSKYLQLNFLTIIILQKYAYYITKHSYGS